MKRPCPTSVSNRPERGEIYLHTKASAMNAFAANLWPIKPLAHNANFEHCTNRLGLASVMGYAVHVVHY